MSLAERAPLNRLRSPNLRSYVKAVEGFRRSLADGASPDATFIAAAYLLFVVLESLRDQPDDLLMHLHNGIRLVQQPSTGGRKTSAVVQIVTQLRQQGISSLLHDTLKASSQAMQDLVWSSKCRAQVVDEPGSFDAIFEELDAVQGEVHQLHRVHNIIHGNKAYDFDRDRRSLANIRKRYVLLGRALSTWKEHNLEPQGHDARSLGFIEARFHLLKVSMTDRCWLQTEHDQYLPTFQTVVELSESSLRLLALAKTSTNAALHPFSMRTGAILMLFIVIALCRDLF